MAQTIAFGVLRPPFVLAPLAGVTDSAFRRICFRCGAAAALTEMVSAKGLHYRNANTEDLLRIADEEGPVGIQLFGSDPTMLAFAAEHLQTRPNAWLDLNMGCPVPKVVKNGEGSALLKSPALAEELVRETAKHAGGKPVTVKMRIGFDEAHPVDPVAFALRMQEAGASAIAVHGRTREQYYSGKADWEQIRRIKEALDIPVIGNGDVFSAEDALRMLDETKCDAVMIARGALGNPWIFAEAEAAYSGRPVPKRPETDEIIETVREHFKLLLEDTDEYRAVREMRKHAAWYTKGIRGAAALRRQASEAESFSEMMGIMERLKDLRPSE
ncbi:MAG: tRNA dihydrouridine synthase DusB [Clostridia bacterium]|nr:tRNA dihydrouridine synthase DusB [Clostridia bacterium]